MPTKKLKVLLLTHKDNVPPAEFTRAELKKSDWRVEYGVKTALESLGHETLIQGIQGELTPIREAILEFRPHIAFNFIEDFDGVAIYDQNIVAYLELLRVPYTGCNPRGLMLSKDKGISKKILSYHKISTPKFAVFRRGFKFKRPNGLEFPLFVKSLVEEASLGISQASIVYNDKDLLDRVKFVHKHLQTDAIAESFIEGRELYVGVMGNVKLTQFPIWELKFKKAPNAVERIATRRVKWNDNYRKKYGINSGPAANLSDEIIDKAHILCKRVYHLLNLNGYARMDLRLTPSGDLFLLEANPNPHIGKEEDFAQSAKAAGIDYEELIQKIISLGLRWKSSES